jgi:Holliday junction resolvase RusA-like endonuclease
VRIQFFCAGIPKSMSVGSSIAFKRNGTTHHFQKRRNTDWSLIVGQVGRQHAPAAPLEGPIAFTAVFYLPKPTTAGKNVIAPLRRPDVDGLVHKLTDHFSGIFFKDDSQIVDFHAHKRFAGPGGQPGVEITVEQIIPSQAELAWRVEEVAKL